MRALVRRPSPHLAGGLLTHLERTPVDVGLAMAQWEGYVAALADHGWEVVEVEPADECPDAAFVEDTAVIFADRGRGPDGTGGGATDGQLAVLANPGADERKPEVVGTEGALRALGVEVARIDPPGTLDGGDVLKVGDTAFVGLSGRTNAAAIAQLERLLAPRGWTVNAVPLTKVLHLKSAVTALGDGTVIGYPPVVDDPRAFAPFLAVPEEPGAHVVLLDAEPSPAGGPVLMSDAAPRTASLLRERGWTPVEVGISEFEKLEGCVTCLSIRLRG